MLRRMIEAAVERALDRRMDLIEAAVEKAVNKVIESRTVRPDKKLTMEGFHPLQDIMGNIYEWLFVPFGNNEILVEVRYLSATQLPDVDKLFHLIDKQEKKSNISHQQMVESLNIQEKCCRAILHSPTFEELENAIHKKDKVIEGKRKHLENIRKLLNSSSGAEKQELQMEYNECELFVSYILPANTMLALTSIALGMDITDIRKVTKEKLIMAYSRARLYGGRPSNYIRGTFTDGDRDNIDDYATMLGLEEEAKNKKQKE